MPDFVRGAIPYVALAAVAIAITVGAPHWQVAR